MAKGFYIHEGKTIDYTNSGEADIAYCEVVPLTSRVGVAACAIPKGAKGTLSISGVYEFPADTAAMTVGQQVHWDIAAGKVVTSAGTAGEDGVLPTVPCGMVVAEKAANTASVLVKI